MARATASRDRYQSVLFTCRIVLQIELSPVDLLTDVGVHRLHRSLHNWLLTGGILKYDHGYTHLHEPWGTHQLSCDCYGSDVFTAALVRDNLARWLREAQE
jgi:hypothetical protein